MENQQFIKTRPATGFRFPRHFFNLTDFAIFDQANDAIFLHNAATGAIINMNRKGREIFGLAGDRMRSTAAIWTGEYPYTEEEALRRIKLAAGGEPQVFEWKSKNKNGRDIWLEINLKAITLMNRHLVLSIVRDITRRKLTEQRLQLQYSYQTLLQETSLAIMNRLDQSDLLTALVTRASSLLGTANGFIYLLNESTGLMELKVTISLRSEVLMPVIRKGTGFVGQVWQLGEPMVVPDYQSWENRIDNPNLDYLKAIAGAPLKSDGRIMGIIGLCTVEEDHQFRVDEVDLLARFAELASIALDNARLYTSLQSELAERKRTEVAMQLSEERYRVLFHNAQDAIYVAVITEDGLPGRIIEVNDTACNRLGYSREELLTLTPLDLTPLEQRGDTQEKMVTLYEEKHILAESCHLTKDGQMVPVEVSSHLLYLDNTPCILSIARDIAERKRVEKEMARLDRLSLIGAMAAGIGHEIRNPLTTVRGFLQMLLNKEETQQHKGYFELMIQELDRANGIITEFLSLAKNKAVDLKPYNLNTIVNILLPLLEAGAILYDKSVKTDLTDIPDIPLDEKEIRQLVLNLVRNGLDAMPPGGCLTIKTWSTDSTVILAVQDQGKGIAPDMVDKIGTPFFTTKEYGVGLGLAVCYSIAARHNANISFDTGTGGTTFYVQFMQHSE